jgi:hypothetical protein
MATHLFCVSGYSWFGKLNRGNQQSMHFAFEANANPGDEDQGQI